MPVKARNMRTGALLWSHEIEADAVLALENGGAVLADENGGVRSVESNGVLGDVEPLGVASGQYAYGRFHARRGDGSLAAVPWKPLDDATAFITERSVQAVGRPAQYGISIKSHVVFEALYPDKHTAFRLVPRRQSTLLGTTNPYNQHFKINKKIFGDLRFMTIGPARLAPVGPVI